jgi:tetratricopeptide (TPR) repeat protein
VVLNLAQMSAPMPAGSALVIEQSVASLRAGDPAEAKRTLRDHLLRCPTDPMALAKLAEILLHQGEQREAILLLRRALQLAPASHGLRQQLARMLYDQGELHLAYEEIARLPVKVRSAFDISVFEALLLGLLGRHEAEIEIYERLVVDRPNIPELWKSYGDALKYAGRSADAVKAMRKAVKLRSSYGEGWWSLANLKTAKFDDRDVKSMRRELQRRPSIDDAIQLNFALGKAYEDRSQHEESFRHYDQGNRLRAKDIPRAQMFVSGFVTESIETFDVELMNRVGKGGHPTREPIFVLGLQRSGSTLIEQILASHPLIEGTSELMTMPQLWSEQVRTAQLAGKSLRNYLLSLSPSALGEIGAEYLERTRPFRTGNRAHFVDKLPANWMHIGLIRLALPNARIIDARRHPMACGFSNFKQHYASGVAFAYSQESIGAFYRDYLRMMRHFAGIEPGAIHLALNESIIEDTDSEVRRLLDFVGISFDQACLDFHQNKRAVNTPSAEQVRQPVNRHGMEYWLHYERWLGPLQRALGPVLADWNT